VPLLALPLLADDIFFLRKKSPNALVTDNALANQSKVEKVEMNFGFVSKKTYDLMINPLNFAIENLGINSSVSIDDINNSKLLIGTCGELCSVLENNTHLQHDQCLCIVKSDREVDRAIKNQFTPIYIGQGAGLSYQTWQLKTSIRDFFWRKFIQASYPLLSYTDQQTTLPPQHSDQPISTRYMYIVTVDMRDYTIFCENKSPADIFNFQYHFLGALTPPVRENQGLIVEFTGDGFLSTFDSAVNAISAVKAMFSALDKFNKDFGYKVKIGIGLDAGSAAISTIGEPNRWTLGLTSDAIITAASIESLSKLYSANVLATEEFVSNLKKDDQSSVNCQLLDAPKIKGRRHAIRLYKLDLAH